MSDVVLRELNRDECLALLATTNLGQLALTRRALPTVVPARYLMQGDAVIVHMSTGLDNVAWIDGEIAALHVSAFDDDQRHGWRVRHWTRSRNPQRHQSRKHPPSTLDRTRWWRPHRNLHRTRLRRASRIRPRTEPTRRS